jgi:hypothetical protein
MGLFSSLFGRFSKDRDPKDTDAGEAARGLRLMMLNLRPEETESTPTEEFPRVYAVLMDWPISNGAVATVFAASTGEASLYTTPGFCVLGGVAHETVRTAAARFVRAANRHYDAAESTTEFPYPLGDRLRFYLKTYDGVRVIDTDMASIKAGASAFTELFGLAQGVVTELRLTVERRR